MSSTWKIQGEEKEKFENIFESLGPTAGKLAGDKVKPVLMNSKLPFDVLGQVWELSDIDKDGFLDKDEFCVAMHLVYKALEKEPVPSTLPPDLIPPSKKKPVLPGAVPVLPMGGPLIPAPKTTATPSLPVTNPLPPVLQPTVNTQPKSGLNKSIVPESEYTRFSAIFMPKASPDGYMAGAAARDIFVQSGLPQTILAHVWNLCDQQQLGKLTQDQFILAMHFINQKVKGIDVPQQLTNEFISPKSRDSGFGDSGNISDSSSSGVGDFSAVRELDALNREIEELRREKETLTAEIREKEQNVHIRSLEVQELQNNLDRQSTSLSQLEADKAESHTRLDELDQQQLKLDGMLADIRSKVQEENRTIANLRSQIQSQEKAIAQREEDFTRTKDELDNLKKQEMQLQQTLESGQQQLESITRQVKESEDEIVKVQDQIKSLEEQEKTVSSNIAQYDKAVSALKSETEATSATIQDIQSSVSEDLFKKETDLFNDPFAQTDDPFASEDAFKSDPFASTTADSSFPPTSTTSSAGFGSPSKDVFGSSDPFAEKSDPFSGEDKPFDSGFSADPFAGPDPFATSPPEPTSTKESSEPKASADMFSSDFFDQENSVSLFNDSDPMPNKVVKDDPADPWAAFGAASVPDSSAPGEDLFGKDAFVVNPSAGFDSDPFGDSATSAKSKNKAPKNIKNMSEDAQLAWAAEQSRIAEEERKEKLRIQEQKDLEYAIKLSQQS